MMTLRLLLTLAVLVPFATGASAQVVVVQPAQPAPQTAPDPDVDTRDTHQWTVSGFLGTAFGDSVAEEHLDFGGSVNYLWRQFVGGEFIAAFSPTFDFEGFGEANLNSYMANAIGALPLGETGRWQPYVSGGVGALSMRNAEDFLLADDQSSWGSNVGAGLMGFADRWGFRADIRYYNQFGDVDEGTLLDNLDFWQANAGVAYRW